MPAWSPARTKVQLKLAIERTKMLQEKKEAIAKKERKEISALIARGKDETARIKTEGIIAEDIHIELLEILELYSETLLARFALLDLPGATPDASILEPIAALIHCAPRVELRELHVLRDMLLARYGREFGQDAVENRGGVAGKRVSSRLEVMRPEPVLVDRYIMEICRAYEVPFESRLLREEEEQQAAAAAVDGEKEEQVAVEEATPAASASPTTQSSIPASTTSTSTNGNGNALPPPAIEPILDPKSGPATRSDAAISKALGNTVPNEGEDDRLANKTLGTKKETVSKEQRDCDDLEKRFAALKKR